VVTNESGTEGTTFIELIIHYFTWPASAYRIAMTQGKQQHSAIPMKKATTTQNTAKNTSKARNTTVNLQNQ
jgi:hypothetical protein